MDESCKFFDVTLCISCMQQRIAIGIVIGWCLLPTKLLVYQQSFANLTPIWLYSACEKFVYCVLPPAGLAKSMMGVMGRCVVRAWTTATFNCVISFVVCARSRSQLSSPAIVYVLFIVVGGLPVASGFQLRYYVVCKKTRTQSNAVRKVCRLVVLKIVARSVKRSTNALRAVNYVSCCNSFRGSFFLLLAHISTYTYYLTTCASPGTRFKLSQTTSS